MPRILPSWLETVRRSVVIDPVRSDPRSQGDLLLGVPRDRVTREVLGRGGRPGQTDFTSPPPGLSTDDLALFYGWFLQKGHLEELAEAFDQLFAQSAIEDPVVVDLGCGPCTGGLALAAVMGSARPFTYVGIDSAPCMHRLGEKLAQAAIARGGMADGPRWWSKSIERVSWSEPLGWRPVVVIVSYLLASTSLDAGDTITRTMALIERISWGPAVVVYTNAVDGHANRQFPAFRAALEAHNFSVVADDEGMLAVERQGYLNTKTLRYALFYRPKRMVLP